MWLLNVPSCDQLKPLSQGITECLWHGVDIFKDDVEGEWEVFHVGADLRKLPCSTKDRNLDVKYGILSDTKQLLQSVSIF